MRDDDADSLDEGEAEDAAALETEADVTCPHCGETMTITLDPGGGRAQEYVEDCQVCCRPWRVRLWYDEPWTCSCSPSSSSSPAAVTDPLYVHQVVEPVCSVLRTPAASR